MGFPATAINDVREAAHLDCIHCGICLSACPTYLHLGNEADSPRGRIHLIHAMQEGRLAADSKYFRRHMQLCLECRACETACPSGVRFSAMMDEARTAIHELRKEPIAAGFLRWAVLQQFFLHRSLLHAGFRMLRFYQRSGLQKLMHASGAIKLLPKRLARMEALLPEVPRAPHRSSLAGVAHNERGRALLFEGCIMPELFGPVHEATIRVLLHNGISVGMPSRQTCCGALHLHMGDLETARRLARANIAAFEGDSPDPIVVNAAGCGAMLKEYATLLADDAAFAQRAQAFSRRVHDVSEFLDNLVIDRKMERVDKKVAYDDPCHLLHAQNIRTAPRNLLRIIPGIQLVELRDSDRCCGSAGIYNLTQPEMAERILEEKIANIIRSGAHVVATGNPGCLLQIQTGLRAKKLPVRVVHPVELLDEAYRPRTVKRAKH